MPNKPRKYWKVREEKHIFIVPGLGLAQANRWVKNESSHVWVERFGTSCAI